LYKHDMTSRLNDRPRGVLETGPAEGVFTHERHRPAPDLAGFIEHFWLVAWDVRGAPVVREVLSHPSVHVVVEAGSSRIVGVPRGRFTRRLEGKGFVVGTKFRPGAFRPLVAFPIARLTDQIITLDRVFGARSDELERTVLAAPTIAARIDAATRFFRSFLPPRDPVADEVAAIVKRILDDREIRRVDDVARIAGASPRALQRLFHDYVGVSPKWVIRRYRMHEVIERMDAGTAVDWSSLALELGYFDQAHFNRDFKLLVGRTPTGYTRAARGSSAVRARRASASASPAPAHRSTRATQTARATRPVRTARATPAARSTE
jgi:AraC-like DNA-binding protein